MSRNGAGGRGGFVPHWAGAYPERPPPLQVVVEVARLAAVRSYGVLDKPEPAELDGVAQAAARALDRAVAGIAVLDADRVWFVASTGLPWRELPRAGSFWERTLVEPGPLVVRDALLDERFRCQPEVLDPGMRFYAGVSLVDEDEYRLGAVFVADPEPGAADAEAVAELVRIARIVVEAFARRRSTLIEAGPQPGRVQGWLGVRTRGSSLYQADSRPGLIVTSVAADSPAEEAGVRPADILLSIDGYPLRHPTDVISALANRPMDGLARLEILRAGQVLDRVVPITPEPVFRPAGMAGSEAAGF